MHIKHLIKKLFRRKEQEVPAPKPQTTPAQALTEEEINRLVMKHRAAVLNHSVTAPYRSPSPSSSVLNRPTGLPSRSYNVPEQQRYSTPSTPLAEQKNEDFGTSVAMGLATGSAALGALAGGSWAGGFTGAALHDSMSPTPSPCPAPSSYNSGSSSSYDSGSSSSYDSGSSSCSSTDW